MGDKSKEYQSQKRSHGSKKKKKVTTKTGSKKKKTNIEVFGPDGKKAGREDWRAEGGLLKEREADEGGGRLSPPIRVRRRSIHGLRNKAGGANNGPKEEETRLQRDAETKPKIFAHGSWIDHRTAEHRRR